ncbi:MAG TPA: HAMP domain-containing sensor histidine kinase [Jiangellaceae bacterium]
MGIGHLSLRARLAALAAAGSVVVLSVAAPLLYRDLSGALSAAITNELEIRVDDLDAGLNDGPVVSGSALVTAQVIDNTSGEVLSPAGSEPLLTASELTRASRELVIINRPVSGVGNQARVLARPIGDSGAGTVGAAATSTQPLTRARDRLVGILVVAGPALVAAVWISAWALAGAALRPVRRMAREAATISAAAAGRRLPEPASGDEIAELGRTLNAMLDRIESTIAREREFIDNAAHELRTPIAVLRGELELAAHDVDEPDVVRQNLTSALEETDRLAQRTENLLILARADAGQLIPGKATTELLAAVRASVRRLPHREDVSIQVFGEPAVVHGDFEWIAHIIGNLVANADRFARSRVVVTVATTDGRGRLTVADDGPGFPPALLPRAFDRFARSDHAQNQPGAGLGLAIVASLTQALGGTVSARNGPPEGGACLQIDLPLAGTGSRL